MPTFVFLLLLTLCPGFALAAEGAPAAVTVATSAFDSKAMEKELQRLTWPQFKSVVEAIPKLKADIEAYGEAGWKLVRTNYMIYGWKRNIDRLDEDQKKELAALIAKAKSGHQRKDYERQ